MHDTFTYLFTAAAPPHPGTNPDLRAQALDLLEAPGRLRASWSEVMRRLEVEGFEAGEFALLCRVHLNLLDNCAALLEVLSGLSEPLPMPQEKLSSAAEEVKSQQGEIQALHRLATSKPPSLDPVKLLALETKYAGQPAVEIGELIRQVQAGEIEL